MEIAPEREGEPIKKNKNTFAKLQRERQKKRKADEKRQRRLERKAGTDSSVNQPEESNTQNNEIRSDD